MSNVAVGIRAHSWLFFDPQGLHQVAICDDSLSSF